MWVFIPVRAAELTIKLLAIGVGQAAGHGPKAGAPALTGRPDEAQHLPLAGSSLGSEPVDDSLLICPSV